MRSFITGVLLFLLLLNTQAQTDAIQQLKLNLEKLAQLKLMLDNLGKGYAVLEKGYQQLQQQSRETYTLHKDYLDALWKPASAIRQEPALAQLERNEDEIGSLCTTVAKQMQEPQLFSPQEKQYLLRIVANIRAKAAADRGETSAYTEDGRLQMTDAARIQGIRQVAGRISRHLQAIRSLQADVQRSASLRRQILRDQLAIRNAYGITR